MKTQILFGIAASAAAMAPSAAAAQTVPTGDVFLVASAGYHDLGVAGDIEDSNGFEIDDASVIYGAAVGFDIPVSENVFFGVEGNFHFGNDVIEHEFGGNARLGFKSANGSKFYARGGYQHIKLDLSEVVQGVTVPASTFDGIDADGGDFLVGVGADVPVGNFLIRGTVDSVSFDTVRATVGVGFAF